MSLINRGTLAATAAVAALLVPLLASPASAAPTALLSTHVPDAVASHAAARVRAPDPAARLHLSISLPLRDEAGLDAFLRDIYNPASPNYRHYLSVADFTARFGPTAEDYKQAADFFSAHGLTVRADAPNHFLVSLDGSVADIERVFHVQLGLYRHPTEQRLFLAPDREPTLDLAKPMLHVTGLDDFQRATPRLLRRAIDRAGTGSGPGGQFLGSDIRSAYYGGGALNGSGQSLGLMELEGYNIADVNTYFSKYGPPLKTKVVGISTDGASLTCTGRCDDS